MKKYLLACLLVIITGGAFGDPNGFLVPESGSKAYDHWNDLRVNGDGKEGEILIWKLQAYYDEHSEALGQDATLIGIDGYMPMVVLVGKNITGKTFADGTIVIVKGKFAGSYTAENEKKPTGIKIQVLEYKVIQKGRPKATKTSLDMVATDSEAIGQWKGLRIEGSKAEGKKVFWKVRIENTDDAATGGYMGARVVARLPGIISKYKMLLFGTSSLGGNADISELHVNDLVIMKGRFIGVDSDGTLLFEAISIEVVGVDEGL